MQNKEFDKLVESFLTPKTKLEENNAFSLASLLSLVEQIERAEVLNEAIRSTVLPSVGKEAKKYEPEPKEVTKFFEMFQSVLAENVLNIDAPIDQKLRQLIQIVNYLKQNNQVPTTTDYLSKTFSIILFVGSLNNMIGNLTPDLPTVAGTFFEKFITFISKGEPVGSENKIVDVKTANEYISLKLVKSFSFTGSINNMIEFFTGVADAKITPDLKDNGNILTTLIGIKQSIETGTIQFYSYKFGLEEFLKMLGPEKIAAYNSSFDLQTAQKQIADLRNKIDQLQTVPADSVEQSEEIEANILDMEQEIKRLSASIPDLEKRTKGRTQFNISKAALDTLKDKLMVGDPKQDVLSMSSEDKEKIIEVNHELFNKNIKTIIEESNAVYYKINNFLLSSDKERKVNATEAYDSVKKLEINLVEYTK